MNLSTTAPTAIGAAIPSDLVHSPSAAVACTGEAVIKLLRDGLNAMDDNRAVAVAMAFGPAAGLELVDGLNLEPSLQGYHLLPAVRGDLFSKLGRLDEARGEFERAAALTGNARERDLLLERARRKVRDHLRVADRHGAAVLQVHFAP